MTAEGVLDLFGALLVMAGAVFSLAAAVGLVRFPDALTRMHAATKPAVFGLLLVLLGVALTLRSLGVFLLLTLAVLLQVMTATVSGHLVSRSAHRSGQWDAAGAVVDELAADQEAAARAVPTPDAAQGPAAGDEPPPAGP
ncbi:MAG TPA: monovalent cation/H(+) antiporter subunit G [Propionicimonas sp.]|jgi:multicomponent Na+:H+ antiporter subunit G|nr:monovalent cation/H(+) antiporter subunit G [Propionicimonas sp.]